MRGPRKGSAPGRVTPRGAGNAVWLVPWEWNGDHAKPEWDCIEAILSPHLGARRVQWFEERSWGAGEGAALRRCWGRSRSPCRRRRPRSPPVADVDPRVPAPYESSSSPATEQRMQGGNMK
jgi:hypothetical protein